jgi:hypothetical protein
VVADGDTAAQGEVGVDPSAAVGLAGGGMHLVDGVSQLGVTDRPRRRRPAAPGVEAGLGDLQHPAADLHREPLGGPHLDRREPSKGALAPSAAHEIAGIVHDAASRCHLRSTGTVLTLCK